MKLAEQLGKKRRTLDKRFVEQDVYELAIERALHAYTLFDHMAVMFSGGKDSTATLHVALEAAKRLDRLPIDVVFFDEEAIPYQTEEYVRRVSEWPEVNLRWLCLPCKATNACSRAHPFWYHWAPEDEALWTRPLPPEAILDIPGWPQVPPNDPERRWEHHEASGLLFPQDQYGNVGMFMGIRAAESLQRTRAVTRRAVENYIIKNNCETSQGNIWKVYPVYDWQDSDVWTAPREFGWDYNRAYDVMEMAGVPVRTQRCSPAFGNEPLQKLWTYSVCFPELWDKMTHRVPGAASAGRYATTVLYGYRSRTLKPPDMEWEDFLMHYIDKFPPSVRKMTALLIRDHIKGHVGRTSDPILEHAPHPDTGVSWEWLLMLAMRSDPKGRKQPMARITSERYEALKANYETERKAWEAHATF